MDNPEDFFFQKRGFKQHILGLITIAQLFTTQPMSNRHEG